MLYYIDPGTGSMLFTILVGVFGAAMYSIKGAIMKARFLLTGGSKSDIGEDVIPVVLFADSKVYWNVFEPICQKLDEAGIEAVYMTASEEDPGLKAEFKHVKSQFIGEGYAEFAKLNFIKADILISTTPGLDVYQWKRSKDVKHYVHVLHAANDVVAYRMFGLDYYDAVLLSGEYQAGQLRELERLRNLPAKELDVVGLTYMDRLLERLQREGGQMEEHERTVLLAPSWGSSSILNRFGSRMIRELLKTGYHIIVRPHPQSFRSEIELMDSLMKEFPESDQLEWNRDNDNFDVLNRSDILISDYSGVMFDFALVFDKPIIYAEAVYDKSAYDACWLEEEMWTFSTLPKIGLKLNGDHLDNMKSIIDECIASEDFAQAREIARNETWMYRGESAQRTVDYVVAKLDQINKA